MKNLSLNPKMPKVGLFVFNQHCPGKRTKNSHFYFLLNELKVLGPEMSHELSGKTKQRNTRNMKDLHLNPKMSKVGFFVFNRNCPGKRKNSHFHFLLNILKVLGPEMFHVAHFEFNMNYL